MAGYFPNVGELEILDVILRDTTPEGLTLKLYSNNYDPVAGTVHTDLTEATFVGYSSKPLTRGTWAASATVSNKAESTYTTQTWTCSGGSPEDIYGAYLVGTTSGTLYYAEKFSEVWTVQNGLTFNFNPKIRLSTN